VDNILEKIKEISNIANKNKKNCDFNKEKDVRNNLSKF
jgi:hypothetical protein